MARWERSLLVALGLVLSGSSAFAQSAPAPAPAPEPEAAASKMLGVGYKIGNGLGFVGADAIVSPVDHLSLDLQANWLSVSSAGISASGYGVAPSVQVHFFKGQVSSPYLGVGFVYATISFDNVTSSASGYFANLGWEWRWASGLGIILGGGVGHLGTIHATNGVDTIDEPGGTHFNLETGLRYMFL